MRSEILRFLPFDFQWKDTIVYFDSIGSTNTHAKQLAAQGAPHGTVLVAGSQTAGRGRLGRSFQSPPGMGMYLSVILRPNCPPASLMHLTCAAAVAACHAIEAVSGICPDIKWTNDLVCNKRKLGGILTELSVDTRSGLVDYAIIGIGINCCQSLGTFPPEIEKIATSLQTITGKHIPPAQVSAAVIEALAQMDRTLLAEKQQLMTFYRGHCITVGKQIQLLRGETVQHGLALDIDDNGGLLVAFANGKTETVTSGEVSVRGLYGYL